MTKFSDLKLDPKVLQAVLEAGYETPTPIQQGAIPPALEGRDVLRLEGRLSPEERRVEVMA